MGVLAKRLVACTQPINSKGTSPCSGPCYGSILGRVGEDEISGKPCSLLLDWIDAKSAREKAGWFLILTWCPQTFLHVLEFMTWSWPGVWGCFLLHKKDARFGCCIWRQPAAEYERTIIIAGTRSSYSPVLCIAPCSVLCIFHLRGREGKDPPP